MSYKIYPLDVGDMELDSSFLSWQTDCGKKVSATTTAWLVTGADKPILIDTSFRSVEDAGKYQGLTCQRSEKQTLEAQLASFEIGLEDVGYIIHTHVHMDHAGQDYLFPNAKIILQRGELQHAAAPNVCPVLFYDRLDVSRLTNELWSQLEFIEGGNSEPFPGIRCEFTPGHTPFHQMVRIDTAAGEYVVAGDAAMLLSNVTNQWMPGIIDSMSGTMTGLKKLQPIVDRVLPTHDRVVAERFSHGIG
jgi:N-acyl homoserine lactone hydrolase